MRKRSAAVFTCAVAGVVSGLTSAAMAGTFTDDFKTGTEVGPGNTPFNSDTIPNFWNGYYYNYPGGPGTLTEPVGGPLTLGDPSSAKTQNGAYIYGTTSNEFNFFQNAATYTVSATAGTSLIAGTDYTDNNASDTYFGIGGGSGYFRVSSSNPRIFLTLENNNTLAFNLEDGNGNVDYSYTWVNAAASSPGTNPLPVPGTNEIVTSLFIYLDGTNYTNDHLYFNFGETVQNTSTGISTTYSFIGNGAASRINLTDPFDLGGGPAWGNKPQSIINTIESGFPSGAEPGLQVLNQTDNANGMEAVTFGQFTDVNAMTFTGQTSTGSTSAIWSVGGANNFNTNTGSQATTYVNGGSVTFDDSVANGGHNTGQFTISIAAAPNANTNSVAPSYINVSGGTPYVFNGPGGINGSGGLTLIGISSLTLNESNSFAGTTNISSGSLIAGALNVLSPNSPVLITGGTLDASGYNQSIYSLNISSGTLKLSASTVLTIAGTANFAGALNLVGTPASLPDILATYQSATGTFATNNLPAGDGLSYTGGILEVISAGPASLTWVNATANGQWDIATSANWNASSGIVNYSDTSNASLSAGDNVTFNDSNGGAGNYNVSIAATVHPTSTTVTTNNAYTFNGSGGIAGPGSLTLSGSGSLTLAESNSYTGGTNVSGGTLFLAKANALPSGEALIIASGAKVVAENLGTAYASTVSSLNMSGGTIDLVNNDLVVQKSNNATVAGNLSAVTTLITTGFNGGAWNGPSGILSSAAAASATHLTALGVIVNDSNGAAGGGSILYGASGSIASTFGGVAPALDDVLVKYTYYGDANLDGKVDGSDYSTIDSTYLSEKTSGNIGGWQNGDFNYDGVVNGSDYTLIDNAFNSQGAAITTEIATPTAQIAGSGATSAVPEPTTLGLLGIGVVGLLGRRNRRSR